jgi:hypothetical protein
VLKRNSDCVFSLPKLPRARAFAFALIFIGGVALRGEPAIVQARALAREALAAAEAQDKPAFLSKMEAAVALRPDYPRLLVNLAEAQVANEHPAEAIATLDRLAALGVHSPVDEAAAFAPLRGEKDFQAVVKRLNANLRPIGAGEVDFTLREMTGLIEGIAWREKTRQFFFGDVHGRTVWVRGADGKVRTFAKSDELFGVFGLLADEERGALWAATSAVSAMSGYSTDQSGKAGLAELDLANGSLRHLTLVPSDTQEHVLGDLAPAPDGSIFLPDSAAPIVWRYRPGAETLERFVESEEFLSLQGAVVVQDGRALVLADYANGLLWIDLATRTVRRMETPPDTTLIGIDGLVATPTGELIAVQNGVRPHRVLRLTIDFDAATVTRVDILESAHLVMADPTLGCMVGDDFVFVANAGWSRFEGTDPKPTSPRPIPILRTKSVANRPPATADKASGRSRK